MQFIYLNIYLLAVDVAELGDGHDGVDGLRRVTGVDDDERAAHAVDVLMTRGAGVESATQRRFRDGY